ncbi:FecR family protein [Mucilaginibacter angelicae]
MEKKAIKDLLNKYAEGKCSEAEKALLESWYLGYNEDPVNISPRQLQEAGEKIFRKLPGGSNNKINRGTLLAAAAVVMLVISLIVQLIFHKNEPTAALKPQDIPPGGNKAILTLAGGKKIDLADAATGGLAVQPGIRILKNGSGQVVYQPVDDRKGGDQAGYNTISTPAGGIWNICLEDGTKVWLNNSSSLTYPASFRNKRERNVTLEGEAYFEVAKDKKHPFTVKSGGQEIKVLGTHFNVRAYKDEQVIRTTLLEGQVKISTADHSSSNILIPGEQALFTGHTFRLADASMEQVMAWKNGYFRFDNTPVEQVMRELARWYDIEVRYEGPVSAEKLNGRISRSKNISKVLTALEATKIVRFKVEGRRVTVMR